MPIDGWPARHAPSRLSHAGGVVFRRAGPAAEILLVSGKLPPHGWVLPKGHIEKGERPEECARREVQEEAGVDAEPVAFIGYDQFTTPQGKSVAAVFFLMEWVRFVPANEERRVCWLPVADALALIRFEGARQIISAAGERLATTGHW